MNIRAPASPAGAGCVVRPACSRDIEGIRAAHWRLLPVSYVEGFFSQVVQNKAPFAAILATPTAEPTHIAAFVTARVVPLSEAPYNDRHCVASMLGYPAGGQGAKVMYVLTVGVQPEHQRCGLGSAMMQAVLRVRCQSCCPRGVYALIDAKRWRVRTCSQLQRRHLQISPQILLQVVSFSASECRIWGENTCLAA